MNKVKNKNEHEIILKRLQGRTAGVFVDEGNVFYSQKELGWHIHWQKFLSYLNEFINVKMTRYYMGMPPATNACEKNILIKHRLEKEGLEVITKPLKKIYLNHQKKDFIYKCNFNVEITRDVLKSLSTVDMVILVSGDSDFIGLKEEVLNRGKYFLFVCFEHNVSWEIGKCYHLFFEDIRQKIEYKEKAPK